MYCPPKPLSIIRRLQENGYQAVLAGGCVRDGLLGLMPNDWDIATSATPDQVEALFDRTIPVGKQFGIIIVLVDGEPYEVATFRGESTYADGRHPDAIRFVPMAEDTQRRDFTVNALLYDPIAEQLHDFVGGEADLKARVIRAVGDPLQRFSEDKLRVLRAIRFAVNLDFQLDSKTQEAVTVVAPEVVQRVSAERIATELEKMLMGGHSQRAFMLLEETRLLPSILPELHAEIGVEQPPLYHPEGDVWQHQLKALGFLDATLRRCRKTATDEAPAFVFDGNNGLMAAPPAALRSLAWATLLHDIGKPPTFFQDTDRIRFNGHDALGAKMATAVLRRLKQPTALIDDVDYLVHHHMGLTQLPLAKLAKRRRKVQDPRFPILLELTRIDSSSAYGDLSHYDYALNEWFEEQQRPPILVPTITGLHLKKLGIPPGPIYRTILDAAKDRELESPFANLDDALNWLRQYLADNTQNS